MTDQKLLKEKSKRTINFNIRLTQSEYDQLQILAGGKRLASFIRDKCLLDMTNPTTEIVIKSDPRLLQQLARIGNNINQIAKNLNSKTNAKNPIDLLSLSTQLQEIQNQLTQIRDHQK
jgi:hypothetical protein